jgi:aspartate--ammonia ligase
MGIRADRDTLLEQLAFCNCEHRKELEFHKLLLEEKLPFSVGGGLGMSRICMVMLKKAHIGEVQASLWDEETLRVCQQAGVDLL